MKLPGPWLLALALAACGGGTDFDNGCNGFCAGPDAKLEVMDVQRIIAQADAEARARGAKATITVVDRAGNVLAVFRMNGAGTSVTTDGGHGAVGGLDHITVIPDTLAAISKAVTGAYLSSEGNAFSTRTAGQIVQEHFDPLERGQPGGPLFGVQFSSLPCSDLATRADGGRPGPGPHRAPLGLAADPGGLPLYKQGALVGGLGVIADGVYGIDLDIRDRDVDPDEVIALAGSHGFEAPSGIRGDTITVDGKTFHYLDATDGDLVRDPQAAPAFSQINGADGSLVAVPGYADATVVAGTLFGEPESGIRPATAAPFTALDGFVLVDGANNDRYPPRDASDAAVTGGDALTAVEVRQILASALAVANRARAQIRHPLPTPARVSIAVVDTFGTPLGLVRSRDAPVFGTDVALQKARTAAFFSNRAAAGDLRATPDTTYFASGQTSSIAAYVERVRNFLGLPNALADGAVAFTDRAGGNLSRPFFPDGQDDRPNGPFSHPIAQWSAFSTGLQEDLVNTAVVDHVKFALGGGNDVAAGRCTQLPDTLAGLPRLANGIQIFPGSVPIYRGSKLVGGIGVSGDGVDQDDMISFLGVHDAGLIAGTFGNAPPEMRADQLAPQGLHLRYVQCPQAPFLDSDEQDACAGK